MLNGRFGNFKTPYNGTCENASYMCSIIFLRGYLNIMKAYNAAHLVFGIQGHDALPDETTK